MTSKSPVKTDGWQKKKIKSRFITSGLWLIELKLIQSTKSHSISDMLLLWCLRKSHVEKATNRLTRNYNQDFFFPFTEIVNYSPSSSPTLSHFDLHCSSTVPYGWSSKTSERTNKMYKIPKCE